jgi:hypothetical protein
MCLRSGSPVVTSRLHPVHLHTIDKPSRKVLHEHVGGHTQGMWGDNEGRFVDSPDSDA